MDILVFGAGIIGFTSAFYRSGDGHQVTVVDAQPGPAMAASGANGGMISAAHCAPWAVPGLPKVAMRSQVTRGAPFIRASSRVSGRGIAIVASKPSRRVRQAERNLSAG